MKKPYWIFLSILVAAVLFLEYDLTRRTSEQSRPQARRLSSSQKMTSPKVGSVTGTDEAEKTFASSSFDDQFKLLTQDVSQLQADPERVESKLKIIASKMTNTDVQKLGDVVSDKSKNGDERAMAVELLARHQSIDAVRELEQFIQKDEPNAKWNRQREFESVLKAQAIEGIATFPKKEIAITSLTSLDPRVSETFLKDRIKRTVAGLKNEAPSVEQQDEQALGRLVE